MAIISVKDFGATGDGVTDDAPAIQAVIDAHPGETIFLPPGDYRIGSSLALGAHSTTLQGVGPSSILRLTDASRQSVISIPVAYLDPDYDPTFMVNGLTIKDLTIDSNFNPIAEEGQPDYFGIFCRQAENLTIQSVTVRNTISDGISISNGNKPSTGLLIEHCHITARRSGIHIGFVDGAIIRNNHIDETPSQWNGPSAAHSIDVEVEGYDLYGPAPHIPFVRNLLIEDNILSRTQSSTSGNGVALQCAYGPLSNVIIRRNIISGHQNAIGIEGDDNGVYGEISGVHDITIEDNWLTCDPDYSVAGFAIYIIAGANVTISGNIINDGTTGIHLGAFSGWAFRIYGCKNVSVTGNTFWLYPHGATAMAILYPWEYLPGVSRVNDQITFTGNSYLTEGSVDVIESGGSSTNFIKSGNIALAEVDWDRTLPVCSFDAFESPATSNTDITVNVTETVDRVFFFVDDVPVGFSDTSPYTFTISPDDYTAETHNISALAIDTSGNFGLKFTDTINFGTPSSFARKFPMNSSLGFMLLSDGGQLRIITKSI